MKFRQSLKKWMALLKEAFKGEEHNYTESPLTKAIFILATPMVFEMLMESVFALVDIYFFQK
jgi:Na+-driven multidrug efflux pump